MDYDLFEYSFINGYINVMYEQRFCGSRQIYYYDNGEIRYDLYRISDGVLLHSHLRTMSTIENVYRFVMSHGSGISLVEGQQVKRSLRCCA